ncbi:MAG TPA: AEC family transporter [Chthoniobacterales bacterium]|jgi:malonate transporter and related proteins|nr:AEC family transporter [Chthoniobacterales bacterium]
MQLIFQSLIPLAFVIGLGWFAGWRHIIDARHSSSLATYVMSFSFPCLLFAKTATTSLQHLFNYQFIAGLSLGLLGMYLVLFLVNRYLRRMSISHSCQTAFVCAFPDMAFMGIPIFLVLFGEESLISIVIGNVITSLIMIPLTVSILEIEGASEVKTNIMSLVLKVFKKPLVLAPIIGAIFSGFSLPLPALARESLQLIGGTTSGVSLFALGLIMSQDKVSVSKSVLFNVFNKLVVHPLIMWGLVVAFGITGVLAKEAILLCALPPAIMTTMFAVKYNVLTLESTSSTVLGTVFALFSMAIIMRALGIGA